MTINIQFAHGLPGPDMGPCIFLTANGHLVEGVLHYEDGNAILTSCSIDFETCEPKKGVSQISPNSIKGWTSAFFPREQAMEHPHNANPIWTLRAQSLIASIPEGDRAIALSSAIDLLSLNPRPEGLTKFLEKVSGYNHPDAQKELYNLVFLDQLRHVTDQARRIYQGPLNK